MRKFFLIFIAGFVGASCSNDDTKEKLNSEENSIMTKSSATPSIGELHNQGLENMYSYLSSIPDLNSTNIHDYSKSFLSSNYNQEASDYYSLTVDGFDFNQQFSEEFNNEIAYLYHQLDEGLIDFDNFSDFSTYMYSYNTMYIHTTNDLKAWEVYVDIFVHSLDYWSTNLDKWQTLLEQNNASNSILNDNKKCSEGSWLKRTWCNTKKFVGADVGGGASNVIGLLLASKAIVFGPVAGVALGASAAAVIIDLIGK